MTPELIKMRVKKDIPPSHISHSKIHFNSRMYEYVDKEIYFLKDIIKDPILGNYYCQVEQLSGLKLYIWDPEWLEIQDEDNRI